MAVGGNEVKDSEDFAALYVVQEVTYGWEQELILFCDGIDATKVNAKSEISCFLVNE